MTLKPFRILLIEDNPADVWMIEEAVRKCRFAVHLDLAADGEEAMESLARCDYASRCPDLVLLDLNLPKRSGHDVLRAMKQDQRTRAVPVIIMSGSDSHHDVHRAYDCQANCYVRKPTSLDDLFQVVAAIENFWLGTAMLPSRTRDEHEHLPRACK